MKILAIGNSFSEDATRYLETVAQSAGEALFVRNLYIGGCSLETHAKNAASGDEAYAYEKDAEEIERISLPDALTREAWDAVTVQQVSGFSGVYDSYFPHLPTLLALIREKCPRTRIVFHRTWAYEREANIERFLLRYAGSEEVMHSAILAVTERIAKEYGLPVIPVGDAIHEAKQLSAFDVRAGGLSLHRDGYHLSLDYGRYLAALVWLKFFTGATPDKVAFAPEGTDPSLIARLKSLV